MKLFHFSPSVPGREFYKLKIHFVTIPGYRAERSGAEQSLSFRNCKIFTITVNKVWLRSDSLTSLGAGFTQIKTEQSRVSQLQAIL